MDWLDELAKEGRASLVGGDGYPGRYTGQSAVLLPVVEKGPPGARSRWVSDPGDILTDKWEGKTTLNEQGMKDCDPDEWLIVEVWDES